MVGYRGEGHSSSSQLFCRTMLQNCTHSTQGWGNIYLGASRRPWVYPLSSRVTCQYLADDRGAQSCEDHKGHYLGYLSVSFWSRFTKPTRFISNANFEQPFSGFASFNVDNTYLGPLQQQCGHRFHVKKLIGKHGGQWRTSPSAAYPSGVCRYLAKLLLSRFVGEFGPLDTNTEEPQPQSQSEDQQTQEQTMDDAPGKAPSSLSSDTVSEAEDLSMQEEAQQIATPGQQPATENATCAGNPIQCNWDGDYHFLADGFGLCSPNRWRPRDRCCFEQPEVASFTSKIFSLLDQAVAQNLGDTRKAAFELALGRMHGSPFSEETLNGLRRKWASLLPRPEATLTPPEGQPFYLELMSQSLQILDDPDWRILT